MKQKILSGLKTAYGILMSVSFFAGFLPLIPFVIALIVGGAWGEKVSVFLYQDYYPGVIILGSVAVVVGVIALYVGKIESLSLKNIAGNGEKTENESDSAGPQKMEDAK